MKRNSLRIVWIILCMVLLLCACHVNPAFEETTQAPTGITLEVDGQQIQFEDAQGKSLEQLLEGVNITLNPDDVLYVDHEQAVGERLVVRVIRGEATQETTEPIEETEPTTEPTEPKPTKPTEPKPTKPKPTQPKPTSPKPTQPKPTTEPKPTTQPKPTTEPTKPPKTVVDVQYYYDCDGSGHGVMVITYSDGTQEEVPF